MDNAEQGSDNDDCARGGDGDSEMHSRTDQDRLIKLSTVIVIIIITIGL
jgi:hypothetical protein